MNHFDGFSYSAALDPIGRMAEKAGISLHPDKIIQEMGSYRKAIAKELSKYLPEEDLVTLADRVERKRSIDHIVDSDA